MNGLIEQAVERLSGRLGGHVPVIEVLAQIAERVTFLSSIEGRQVVVKVDGAAYRGNRETVALRAAGEAGLPVPEVLIHDPDRPQILVLSHIPGIIVDGSPAVSPWIQAGAILRALHDLPVPPELRRFDWFGTDWNDFLVTWGKDAVRTLRGKVALRPKLLTSLEDQMVSGFEARPSPARVFLHGDCQFAHFVLSPKGRRIRGVVDFGDAGSGDPMWDIATLVLWDPAMMNPVMKGYDAGFRLVVRGINTIRPYVILRHLAAVGWLVENDFSPVRQLRELATYEL